MATILLTPRGLTSLTIPQKYRVDDILDLDQDTIKSFASILHTPESKYYQVLYTLAINNLLITPSSDNLVNAFENINLDNNPSSLRWIQKNRNVLTAMDELIVSEGSSFKIPIYGLSFTGKRSGIFHLFSNILGRVTEPPSISSFERSFYILPDKFIGGTERIDDQNKFRATIRSAIEANFILNDTIVEQTFNLIDQTYFSGLLKYRLQAAGKKISFRISNQMTRTAGSMTDKSSEKEYVITISARLNEVLGNKLSSGISVNGPIDAFIVTLQHEIIHLIVHLEMDRLGITSTDLTDKNKILPISADSFKSHGAIFQNIGERFFGLTERTHSLFETESEDNDTPKLTPNQLKIGTRVYFDSRTTRMYGHINKLNPKRCKVRTDNGEIYNVHYQILHLA